MTNHKILILILILFVFSCTTNEIADASGKIRTDTSIQVISHAKSDTNKLYNVTINDTFFFRRIISNSYTDIVFIDKNRNNKFYKELQHEDEIDISYIYEYFKTPLKRINTGFLPDKWIELIRYKGEFYVYRPSNDWYNLNRFILNDSIFISCFSDPYIRPLKSIVRLSDKKSELTLLNIDFKTRNKIEEKMKIYKIDNKRQIFLFENSAEDSSLYYFATPVKNVFSFDLIDIQNSEMKSFSGLQEDKINYKELISSY